MKILKHSLSIAAKPASGIKRIRFRKRPRSISRSMGIMALKHSRKWPICHPMYLPPLTRMDSPLI